MRGLAGKVAVIAGGAGSIGRAILARLLEEGCLVTCLDLRTDGLEEFADPCPDRFLSLAVDLADEAQLDSAFDAVLSRFGRIDLLVNAAGLVGPTVAIAETSIDQFDSLFRSNVRSTFLSLRAGLRRLYAQGRGGAVVNLTSSATDRIRPGRGLYAMTKRAVAAMSIAAALESAGKGVRVNCVAPGPIDSEMYRTMLSGGSPSAGQPAGPVGQPGDVAAMVAFLLSEEAAHCTGHVYFVDGGAAA